MCSITSPLPPDVVFGSLTLRIKAGLLCLSRKSKPARMRICHAGPERLWHWDPTLGLINDVRDPRMTFPAAALSRAFVLSFVYLVFPIRLYNDHKYSSPP
jgi:hypothetical protein